MKKYLTILFITCSGIAICQNVKKSIDKNDVSALKSYINSVEFIEDEIAFSLKKQNTSKTVYINPLEYAVLTGNMQAVKVLTKQEDKYEDFNETVSKAFNISIKNNNDSLSSYLFQFDPNVNEICNICNGNNAIMYAVNNGNEFWYFKLKPHSELNLINEDGNNVMHLISEHFNSKIFNDLLNSSEIDYNIFNKQNKSPLHIAAINGVDEMFFKLMELNAEYQSIEELFADAIYGGNLKIINYFEEQKLYEPDFLWEQSSYFMDDKLKMYYPYELAILSGNPKVLNLIIDKMLSDIDKDTTNSHRKIMYELLSGTGDDFDHISLSYAIEKGQKDMFELILKTAVEFNQKNYQVNYVNEQTDYSYSQTAKVYFTKYDFRAAKRKFGNDEVTQFYKSLNIEL